MLTRLALVQDTAAHATYTLSLHDALPIYTANDGVLARVAIVVAQDRDHTQRCMQVAKRAHVVRDERLGDIDHPGLRALVSDRKSTRLNSSHPSISYAVFCLKKKTQIH